MTSGARAAISGYRKQALYTLDLMLRESLLGRKFQPEGLEDLAIFKDDVLERVVQVKAYADPLALSDLGRSFFRRIALLAEHIPVEIVSFGELGPELEGIRLGEIEHIKSVRQKLVENYGLSDSRSSSVTSRLRLKVLEEPAVESRVLNYLGATAIGGNPERAFELLTWWILQAAENSTKITLSELRDSLQLIGRYFSERKAKHEEWFTTIKPLEENGSIAERRPELAKQYYRGAAARYSHICAGLDVRRETLLAQIEEKFCAGHQVVILHGASGQGKTSLALRYLHDYVPAEWRLMVTAIDNRRHAATVANALADHLHVVNAPIYLLIDVAPTDLEWVALVRELLDKPNVRIIIAIREEDLARRRASNPELGFPADIALDFTLDEAETLYRQLERDGEAQNAFPTFIEAWERFGGKGPLLEFVYLITQTESLRDVLASQVQRLRYEVQSEQISPSALRFLHICALANAFEARTKVRPLAHYLDLADPTGILQRFEKEYLLRRSSDQQTAEALHPVRSTLLAEILDDPAFAPKEEIALEALQFVPEPDLQIFLLYVFSRLPQIGAQFQAALSELQVASWTGAAGVGRSLIWRGIRCYQDDNRAFLTEAEQLAGEAWIMFMQPDIAGAGRSDLGAKLLGTFRSVNPSLVSSLEELRSRLPPTQTIFEPLSDWISNLQIEAAPSNEADWEGLAELLLWAGRLDIPPPGPVDIKSIPVDILPLDLLGDISVALYESLPALHDEFQGEYGDLIRERFRKEAGSLVLDDSGGQLFSHFIVPYGKEQDPQMDADEAAQQERESLSESLTRPTPIEGSLSSKLNAGAVDRASLLRCLFPQRDRFCTQGHGHQITNLVGGFELPHDDSRKNMRRRTLKLHTLVETNSVFRALDEYRRRPEGWAQFAAILLDTRDILSRTLLRLQRSLVTYFRRSQPYDVIGGRLTEEMWAQALEASRTSTYLPKSAVDEFGFSSETKGRRTKDTPSRSISVSSSLVFQRHQSFKEAYQSYLNSASLFLQNARVVCFCHSKWGRQAGIRAQVTAALAEHGYGDDKLRLSKHNLFELMNSLSPMQEAFDGRLGALVEEERLISIKRRESRLFPSLWALWFQFCHHPERRLQKADVRTVSAFEASVNDLRRQLVAKFDESEEWSVSLLDRPFQWKGQHALVLQVELKSIVDLETARTGVLASLGEVLGAPEPGTLGQYARDYYWPHVLVVPTFNALALEKGCWVIPATVFFNMGSHGGPDRPWLRPIQPLSNDQMQALGLTTFVPAHAADESDKLQQRFAEASGIFAHMSNFVDLIPQLDDLGEQILEEYLREPLKVLKDSLIDIHALSPTVISLAQELSADNEELRESLVEPLEEIFHILDDVRDGRIEIALPDAAEKAARFGELAGHMSVLRWLGLAGSLEVFLDNVEASDAGLSDS